MMRLHSAPVYVAALFLMLSVPVSAQRLEVRANNIQGLEIIGPDSPAFGTLLREVIPEEGNRAILQPVLRYSFFLKNTSNRAIQEITVRSKILKADGAPIPVTAASNSKLPSGGIDLWTPSGSLQMLRTGSRVNYDRALRLLDILVGLPNMSASVDSIIYDNNEFVGPDEGGGFQYHLDQNLSFREMLGALEGMSSKSDEEVRSLLRQLKNRPTKLSRPSGLVINRDIPAAQFLGEVLERSGRVKMEEVALKLKAAQLPDPWKSTDRKSKER